MADLFDSGVHQFESWAAGSEFQARWFGPFNADMTAKEAWKLNDCEGKVMNFEMFERGWNHAQAKHKLQGA